MKMIQLILLNLLFVNISQASVFTGCYQSQAELWYEKYKGAPVTHDRCQLKTDLSIEPAADGTKSIVFKHFKFSCLQAGVMKEYKNLQYRIDGENFFDHNGNEIGDIEDNSIVLYDESNPDVSFYSYYMLDGDGAPMLTIYNLGDVSDGVSWAIDFENWAPCQN